MIGKALFPFAFGLRYAQPTEVIHEDNQWTVTVWNAHGIGYGQSQRLSEAFAKAIKQSKGLDQ